MARHETLRERCWLWGQAANSHYRWVERESSITPHEAARWLDIPNVMLVVMGNEPAPAEFPAWQAELNDLARVVWSIMGDASSHRNDTESDLDAVLALAAGHPNITGAIMDDLFIFPGHAHKSGRVARWTAERIAEARAALHAAAHPLALHAVFYSELLLADDAYVQAAARHLVACDRVTFWTWEAANLARLDDHFARLEALTGPSIGKLLGLYLWDYGGGSGPMPLDLLERQCETARAWLHAGRIEGLIFLGSPICDLDLPAVAWARAWLARVGDEALPAR